MDDDRLVVTAVIGGRRSKDPAFLPPDYEDAARFVRRYRRAKFFCGIYLGGCGWPLAHKVCATRKSHWAHHPGGPECKRSGRDDSADHLYIRAGLLRLLGKRDGESMADEMVMDGKHCSYNQISRGTTVIRIQYSNIRETQWDSEDRALRRRFTNVHWLIGPSASSTAEFIEIRKGWVLRADCRTRGGTRQVLVRLDGGAGKLEWTPLSDCTIDANGRVTGPTLRKQRALHQKKFETRRRDRPAPIPAPELPREQAIRTAPSDQPDDATLADLVRPFLDHTEAAMARDDLVNLESHLEVHKREFGWLRHSGLAAEQARLNRITTWRVNHYDAAIKHTPDTARADGRPRHQSKLAPPTTRSVLNGWSPSSHEPTRKHGRRTGKLIRAVPTPGQSRQRGKTGEQNRNRKSGKAGVKVASSAQRPQPTAKIACPSKSSAAIAKNRTPASAKPKPMGPSTLTGLAAKLEPVLRDAARSGRTVPWGDLSHCAGQKRQDIARALAQVERHNHPGSPLLTALIVGDRNKVHRIFGDVLVMLGYTRIVNDLGLDLAGDAERDRVYAYHARPRRPLPESRLPRMK